MLVTLSDTLRVFFGGEGPFTNQIHHAVFSNPNLSLRVLLLRPNSKLALYRSEAETIGAPFLSDSQYRAGGFFRDSITSLRTITRWNSTAAQANKPANPIDVRFFDSADFCLAVIFPECVYTAQYLYADANAQVHTPLIPLLKYSMESTTYMRLLWNFNWVWNNSSFSPEDVEKSLEENPIVALRQSGKLTH